MIALMYITISACLFTAVYFAMPVVVRWTATRCFSEISSNLSNQLSGDIRTYLEKAQSSVFPELRGQVIAHIVEPWIRKFTVKCADVLASKGGNGITEKYTEILVKAVLKKRLLLSLLISHLLTLAITFGYYLREVF